MVYIQGMNPTKVVPVAPVGWRVVAWLGAVVGSCVELKDDWAGDWEGAREGAVVGPCHFQVHRLVHTASKVIDCTLASDYPRDGPGPAT